MAGDDLFQDFQADLKRSDDGSLSPGDRHVYRNVRDVLERGSEVTCLSCHRVHGDSAQKHHVAQQSEICQDCHNATGSKKDVKRYQVHSDVCGY
ncbi:hypothetical protein SBA6_220005 [Candidatus Sulfopaludibacter sp. SbA6]|nr:hypothetical protein SBA6_220005 [Candidatus Sulfopaludibacter sp. SbA6]